MSGKRAFPEHIGRSRQFKARKRRELAALEAALRVVHTGCAFTPMRDVGVVLATVRKWREDCSEKAWGR